MIAEVSTTGNYIAMVTSAFVAIGSILGVIINNYNNKAQNKATVRKTEVDISNAINDRLTKENDRLQKENEAKDKKIFDLLKTQQANLDLITELIKAKDIYAEQIHNLEIKVQQLSNEIQLLTLKLK